LAINIRNIKNKFVKKVSLLVGATAVAQLILILSMPLLSRLYTPEDFGVLAIYSSILAVISVVASLCYESAIPLPKKDETAAYILLLTISILIVLTVTVSAAVYLFGEELMKLTNGQKLIPYLWLVPLGFVGAGFCQLLNYWAVRKKDYWVLARTKVSRSGGQALTQMAMGWLQIGPIGLVTGHIASQVAGALSLCFFVFRDFRNKIALFSVGDIRKVALRYHRFPKFFAPAAFLYSVGLHSPSLLLASFYGLDVAGCFLLAQRMVGFPSVLIGDSIADVYYAEAADVVRNDPSLLRGLFSRLAKKLFLLGILPTVLLMILGEWGFVLILGEAWRVAGSYVAILSAMFLMRFITAPLATTLSLLEKQHLFLVAQIILVTGSVGSIVVSIALGLTHKQAIGIFSATMCIAYFAEFCILLSSVVKSTAKCCAAP
jgi:O-antigen/teichoic acid export membrane protein